MRKSPLKKKSKATISKLQRELWQLCRQLADKMYPNECYTCGAKNLQGSNKQLGHLWAKASLGANLKYDMRVLRWQCFRDNIHHGGAGAIFYARMLRENGQEYMDALMKERQVTVKAYDFYLQKIEEYKEKLK